MCLRGRTEIDVLYIIKKKGGGGEICHFIYRKKWVAYTMIRMELSSYNYPLANEVAKGYSNATVRPSVTSL